MKNDFILAQSQETFAQRSARKNSLHSLIYFGAKSGDICAAWNY